MTTYNNHKSTIMDKVWIVLLAGAMIALFLAMSQNYWRGDDMLSQMKANCAEVGGTMTDTKGVLGTTYKCSPRLDKQL